MTVNNVVVGSSTSLTANLVLDPAAGVGPRTVTVTTAGGTSAPQGFTITLAPPTLTSVSPNQAIRGTTVAVTLTGTDFVVGATTVAVGGGGVTVTNLTVGSSTSLTASFVLDLAAVADPRTATVTTPGGTSAAQAFAINLPAPGSTAFSYTGGPQSFVVPPGVISVTIRRCWPSHRARRSACLSAVLVNPAASTEAAQAPGSEAAAGALRACLTASPRS